MKLSKGEAAALVAAFGMCTGMVGFFVGTKQPANTYRISGERSSITYVYESIEEPIESPVCEEDASLEPSADSAVSPTPEVVFPIDINTADAALLTELPGIGEVKAASIVAYREEHGPFHVTEELLNVSGIGDATYEKLKSLVTIGEVNEESNP